MKKPIDARKILELILNFMQMLMTETLAKRIVSMVLITAGVPDSRVTELTGLSDRSVRSLRKRLEEGDTEGIFFVRSGGNVKGKLSDYEAAIVEEIENGNYTSRQQIVDMVYEKHGIKTSITAISKLLKKTASSG
jgi:transposase